MIYLTTTTECRHGECRHGDVYTYKYWQLTFDSIICKLLIKFENLSKMFCNKSIVL